jgi:RNA recognition motif-containing protein
MKRLYVGNLPWTVDEDDLKLLFAQHGEVRSARVMIDNATGKSRGFAFIEMDDEPADRAIKALSGYALKGRAIVVNEARS